MELLRRDAELRAEAELEAVREARGGVPVHDGGVHVAQEVVGVRLVGRDYALRMLGAVAVYVLDGGLDVGDDLDGHGKAEIFVRPVGLGGRDHALGVARRGLVAVELHVLVRERLQKRLEVLLSPVLLHQQGLGGVADAGALGLGVYDYGLGHRVVSALVHVDVAVAGAGLQDGHGGVHHGVVYEPRAAAGDDEVDVLPQLEHAVDGLVARVLDQADRVGRDAGGFQRLAHDAHQRRVRLIRRGAAAQEHRTAGLEGQRRGVHRDVRPRLVDDADDAHRHADLADDEPVGAGPLVHHAPDGVGQRRHLVQALGHAGYAVGVEHQAVEQGLGHAALAALGHVFFIGREDLRRLFDQSLCHGTQRLVFSLSAKLGDFEARGLCGLCAFDECFHSVTSVSV